MAKSRDRGTRLAKQYEKEHNEKLPVKHEFFPNDASLRYKGRRGVRARARQQRINERFIQTITQPSGGTITNS